MELTEEIKNKDEVFSDERQEDIFYSLLNGKTVKETIETSRGNFVVKFPKQKDLIAIDRRVAAMRNGIPAANFDNDATFNLYKVAFLDVVVESGEDWFNNLKKKNDGFSWGDMPDVDFINEVYVKAWSFRAKVQSNFKHNEGKTDNGTADAEDVQDSVGDGLFSGVAATVKGD